MADNDTINSTKPPVEDKKHESKGDKLFDGLVYGWLNNVGTFVLTLVSTYWLKHGGGSGPVNHASQKLGEALSKVKVGKGNLGEHTNNIVMTTLLGIGGSLMIVPIKLLEDSRKTIVNGFNKTLGDKTDPSQLKEAPKQSWGSLLLGRVTAWCMVFASITGVSRIVGVDKKSGLHNFERFENWFAKTVTELLGRPTHTMMQNGKQVAVVDKALQTAANESKTFKYGKIGAIDLFATVMATALLFVSSRAFARHGEQKHEEKEALAELAEERKEAKTEAKTAAPAAEEKPTTQVSGTKLAQGAVKDVTPELDAQPQLS